MNSELSIGLVLLLTVSGLTGCAGTEQDFCQYLSLEEAQAFDRTISSTEMRQTERVLYCVYKSSSSDRLFVSLDRALKYSPEDFLKVVTKNSPEEFEKLMTFSESGIDTSVLFLGDEHDELELDFLISQDSEYSVTIRARDVTSKSLDKIDKLKELAKTVLSRL